MGMSPMEFAAGPGNRIVVSGDTVNLAAYRRLSISPATAEAMSFDGVKGKRSRCSCSTRN
jgi:hypothetical protein